MNRNIQNKSTFRYFAATARVLAFAFVCSLFPVPCFLAVLAQAPAAAPRSPAREPWMDLPPTSTGLAVGDKIPAFKLRDQFGRVQDFNSIRGPKGAAIFFNRSADW